MRAAVGARSCARARRALSLVLDDEGRNGDRQELARHLHSCGACADFASAVLFVTGELRTSRQPTRASHTGPGGSTP